MIFKRTEILDPRREWIRQHLPNGRDGFVMEDLDGIVCTFKNFKRGKMFFESKWNVTELPAAQRIEQESRAVEAHLTKRKTNAKRTR